MPALLDDPDISAGLVPAKGEDPDISAGLVPMKSSAQDDPDLSAGLVPISAPTQTPVPTGSGSSREQDNATPVQPRVAVPAQPAGAVGPLPGIKQPQVAMRVPSVGQTLTGVNPKGVPPTEAYDYGGAGVNEGIEGIKQLGQAWGNDFSFNSQDAKQGLTKTINGVMSAGGSSMIGQANPMAIRALAAAVAGGYVTGEAARRVTKALGLDPDAQDLAAALGNIAGGGVSARAASGGGLGPRVGAQQTEGVRPEYRSTPEPSVEIPDQKALPAPKTEQPGDVATHIAGKVTAIDAHTGLPIVDRTRPSEATLSVKGEDLPPQSGEAGKMSPEAEKASAERSTTPPTGTVKYRDGKPYVVDQKTGWWVPQETASAKAAQGAAASAEPSVAPNPAQQIGTPENGTGRIILQPSNSVSQNQELATAGLKEILPSLKQTITQIPGASLDAVRETKDADRTREKVEDEGKSPASIPDFSALRISVDSPAAKTQLADAIRSQFPIAREKDEFENGSPGEKFNAHMMQVQSPNGATHEIQILPKETADIAEPTHDLYEQARGGDQDARASLRQQNAAAMEKFNQRNQPGQNLASADEPDISAGLVPIAPTNGTQLAAPATKRVTGFQTSQGSRYSVDEQGTTQRTKSLHAGHLPTDAGEKPRSEQTVYVSPEHSRKIGELMSLNSEAQPAVRVTPDGLELSYRHGTKDGKQYGNIRTEVVPFSKEPKVGNAPVEFWNHGKRVHAGNEITSITPVGGSESDEKTNPDLSAGLVPKAESKLAKGQRVILPDGRSGIVEFYDSALTKRARIVADDGERIPSIAGKSLTPLAPVNIGEPKTNSPLEASMTKKVREKGPQLVAKYLKDNTTDGVPYIGTDQAKRLFLEYSLNPTAGNEHSDQAASAISHAAWDTALAKPVTGNKNMVRILTGAPASGKTTAIKEAPPGTRVGINRESIIGDAKYGAEMVDQVLASGRKPEIHLVYTDDPRINVQRMIDRAKQIGRVVPIDYMARTFVSVPKAIAQLHERYGDKIAVDSFDTSGPVKMHRGTVEPAVAATSKWNEQTALEAMNEELERLHQAGDVPEAIYSAAKQPFVGRGGSPAERGADITGSEPRSAEEKGLQLNAGQRQASTPPERTDETANTVRTARESAGGGGSARESEGAEQSNGVDKKESGGTFYSGFLDPELFKTLFPDIADRMSDWLSDEVTPGDEQKEMMRQTRGEMDRRVAAVAHKLEVPRKSWMLRSRADSMAFWNAVESGDIAGLQQRDQALARTFKGGFDKMKADLQKLKPEVLQNYIENYFPHIWEQPSQARKIIAQVLNGKRPFAGSASFLKQRTIPTMQDGINMGLTPKSWNPVDQFLTKYSEMAQFLMGHQTLDMMKTAGTAKMVRVGEKAPSGWSQLDDRIGTVMSRDVDDHLFIRGHYYAPPDAARAFNNFVSRGLAGRSGIYDTLAWMNNNMNALQLGISAFHATTTSVNAATSEIALGIKQLSEGKPIKAAGHILSGASTVPSVIRTVVNGSRLMREYLEPGSYAKMSREAGAIAEAGGRIKQNTLELKPFEKMANAFRNGAIGEGLSSIPGTILHATVAPVMEYWVPRMKLGAFYDMAHDVLDQAQKNDWGAEETRRAMQKAWDSVDNRFGQVVYDNLFWHKAMRDALQLATRSVGWNYGSLAELGGAATDTIKEANKGLHGDRPGVTDRMAFAFALPLYTALVGATLTYLWTGEKPATWKDYFYPKRKDGTQVSIPGYMKDVVAFAKHPVGTIENKMAPIWEMTGEAINNRDFYGTEIRHKDDSPIKQFEDVAKWAAGAATPFAFSGTQKMLENKGEDASMDWHHPIESAKRIGGAIMHHPGDLALGNLGFQPAPAYIQNSPALNLAREYGLENRPPGTKTQAQAERQKAMHSIEDMYRTGNVNQTTIDRYVTQGKIAHADIFKARMFAKTDPLAHATRALTIEQALNVYEEANDKEKQLLRPILEAKRKQIHEISDPDKRQEAQESFRRAMGGEALQVAHVHGGT